MVFDRFRLRRSESAALREIKSQIEGHIQVHTTHNEEDQHSVTPPVLDPEAHRTAGSDNASRSSKSMSNFSLQNFRRQQSELLVKMILILGVLTTGSFLWIGLAGAL